jgi:hypothetical protein
MKHIRNEPEMPYFDKSCNAVRSAMQILLDDGDLMSERETALCLLAALGEALDEMPVEVGNVIAGVCATMMMRCFPRHELVNFMTGENPFLH